MLLDESRWLLGVCDRHQRLAVSVRDEYDGNDALEISGVEQRQVKEMWLGRSRAMYSPVTSISWAGNAMRRQSRPPILGSIETLAANNPSAAIS